MRELPKVGFPEIVGFLYAVAMGGGLWYRATRQPTPDSTIPTATGIIEPYVVRSSYEVGWTENPLELYIVPRRTTSPIAQETPSHVCYYDYGFIDKNGMPRRVGRSPTLQEVVDDITHETAGKQFTGLLFHANDLDERQRAFVARELRIPKVAYVPPAFDDI